MSVFGAMYRAFLAGSIGTGVMTVATLSGNSLMCFIAVAFTIGSGVYLAKCEFACEKAEARRNAPL